MSYGRVERALRARRVQERLEQLHEDMPHLGGGPHDHEDYATDADLAAHAATPHGGEAGPHTHDDYATTAALDQVAAAADTALGAAQAADTGVDQVNADLEAHALTAHGLASHAVDGVYHSGAEVLPTTGQKNALAGTSGTPGSANPYVTDQDARLADDRAPTAHGHTAVDLPGDLATTADVAAAVATKADDDDPRLSDARTPTAHSHVDGDLPAGLARDAEVTAAIAAHVTAEPHEEPGAGGQLPVGSLFLATVATDPATLLGYGTWARVAEGRFLVGLSASDGDFDAVGNAAGSKTHTHAGHSDHGALSHAGAAVGDHSVTQPNAHTDVPTHTHATDSQGAHVHAQQRFPTATGGSTGFTVDTSMSGTPAAANDTASGGAHTHTAAAPAGAVASQPHAGTAVSAHSVTQPGQHAGQSHSAHDTPSHVPPGFVCYVWERTA